MPNGTIIHSFIRYVGENPVNGKKAVAVAVLSVSEPTEGTTYAGIARALAADYLNIYYVDLDTEKFIEYISQIGGEELAMERHGENFFQLARQDAMTRVYEKDLERFLASFTRENVVHELDELGVFTITYRLMDDDGKPAYAHMKVTRLHAGSSRIIAGVSIIDSQMKQQELFTRVQRERDVLKCVAALSSNYMTVYSIDSDTGRFIEFNSTQEYESLGLDKEGEDFFAVGIRNGKRTVFAEDLPLYLEKFNRENVMRAVDESGSFNLQYRLVIHGKPTPVSLRIAKVEDGDGKKLVAGVRAWQARQPEKGATG